MRKLCSCSYYGGSPIYKLFFRRNAISPFTSSVIPRNYATKYSSLQYEKKDYLNLNVVDQGKKPKIFKDERTIVATEDQFDEIGDEELKKKTGALQKHTLHINLGDIVEYVSNKERRVGTVVKTHNKRSKESKWSIDTTEPPGLPSFTVRDSADNTEKIYELKIGVVFSNEDRLSVDDIEQEIEAIVKNVNDQKAFGLRKTLQSSHKDTDEPLSVEEVANHLSLKGNPLIVSAAVYRILHSYPKYFKLKTSTKYYLTPEVQLERINVSEQTEMNNELNFVKFSKIIEEMKSGKQFHFTKVKSICGTNVLKELQSMALKGICSKRFKEIVLNPNEIKTKREAFDLVVQLNLWDKSQSPVYLQFLLENPCFMTSSTHVDSYIPDCIKNPKYSQTKPIQFDRYENIAYAIDPENATESDDAISLQYDSEGKEWLCVHICCPAELVSIGSPESITAYAKKSSVYFTKIVLSMLPTKVVNEASMGTKKETRAITFACQLDANGKTEKSKVHFHSLTNVHRLSFAQAQRLLHAHSPSSSSSSAPHSKALQRLFQLTSSHSQARNTRSFPLDAFSMDHSVGWSEIKDSFTMVREAMFLAGSIAADYANKNQIPFLYRSQQSFREKLGKAVHTTKPGAHAGVGLNLYSQITSPLRRFLDLALVWQLSAFLNGTKVPFSTMDLQLIARDFINYSEKYNAIQAEDSRFWQLKNIEESLAKDSEFTLKGTIRFRRGTPGDFGLYEETTKVEIESLKAQYTVLFNRQTKIDETVTLKVAAVDAHENMLHLYEDTKKNTVKSREHFD